MSIGKVRARFWVSEIKRHHNGIAGASQMATVRLVPYMGKGDDNADWSKYTPAGNIEMSITNPDAVAVLELGKSFYVDFTPVEEA